MRRIAQVLIVSCLSLLAPIRVPTATAGDGPIQDNSFLIEEAYNQEPGVIQHIFTWERDFKTHDWLGTLTDEWPVVTQKHQISFTLPFQHINGAPDADGLGDTALNYRYQLLGDGTTPVALSPRFSLIVPSGDYHKGLGNGVVGYQFNLPLSVVISEQFVTHWNLGATYTPGAKDAAGNKDNLTAFAFGTSVLWLVAPNVNFLVESLWTTEDEIIGWHQKLATNTFVINPGIRAALNFDSGLQIVPGLSVPVTIGPDAGETAIFVYLSLEHPLPGLPQPSR